MGGAQRSESTSDEKKAAAAAASDNCKPKRKYETKAFMVQRLVDASRSSWTREECESMTQVKLMECLRELDLPGHVYVPEVWTVD